MRFKNSLAFTSLMVLMATMPAQAQTASGQTQLNQVDKRVGILESQMRAVQRQVFPGGDKRFFTPEITEAPKPVEAAPAPGTPATSAILDLSQRVSAIEEQQRTLTGQLEQLQHQVRQMETAMQRMRGDVEYRLDTLEGKDPTAASQPGAATPPTAAVSVTPPAKPAVTPPAAKPATPVAKSPAAAPAATPAAPTTPEAQYQAGYALYTKGDHDGAQKTLNSFLAANPKHVRASNAQFWIGRSLLAQNKTADAAKAFLTGYQKYPRGERAPNSLLYLGKSLLLMKQPQAACQALDQLKTAYPEKLVGSLATDVAATRTQAKCA